MSFRTAKCTHGEKGMCIHCMVNKSKKEKSQQLPLNQAKLQCKHPPHMKCLRCLPQQHQKTACLHPDYQICKKCQHLLKYDKFSYYLQNLNIQCAHKRPCTKCVPALSRKTYFIDKQCKKHLPYPQALCESCMAPTVTISQQKYTHINRVVIKTKQVYRIVESKFMGILLGRIIDDVAYVQDIYFPQQQQEGSNYINPFELKDRSYLFSYFNLKEIGILYSSSEISGLNLMVSSLFQDKYLSLEQGHPISKFITMRLQLQGSQPHIQCFMVSDQFQAFHHHGIIYQKENHENYFDLITARDKQNHSKLPTFLREGIQTDKLYFKQSIVWIPNSQDQMTNSYSQFYYPYLTLEKPTLENFKHYIQLGVDPLQKYRNIQFLLHLQKLIGRQSCQLFLINFYLDDPQLYLKNRLQTLQRLQIQNLKQLGRN